MRRARPLQFQERLNDVLDVDVALLAYIERQMLEVLPWSLNPTNPNFTPLLLTLALTLY